jgi:hypothetical protein
MGQFIQFLVETHLTEAKSGAIAWNFYYRGRGPTATKMKHDARLYDLESQNTGETIAAGASITVNGEDADYNPKIHIIYNDKHYRVSLTDVSKPIAAARRFGYLKPDKLGLAGREIVMSNYANEVHSAIDQFSAPKEVKEYLHAVTDWAVDPMKEQETHDAWVRSGIRGNLFEVGTVNNDFLEVVGPLLVPAGEPHSIVFFPTRGNEPLFDFIVDDIKYSSKRLSGHVNTLKVDHILQIVEGEDFTLARINKSPAARRGLEVMKIIKNNSVKTAGKALHDWLTAHGHADDKVQMTSFNAVMRSVTDRLNTMISDGTLSCDIAINSATSNVVFCKAEIVIGSKGDEGVMTDGTIRVQQGYGANPATFQRVKFRYKGRDNEKLGFDLN